MDGRLSRAGRGILQRKKPKKNRKSDDGQTGQRSDSVELLVLQPHEKGEIGKITQAFVFELHQFYWTVPIGWI